MEELLRIPEIRDIIADHGIPNYQYLRCLNKEFHEIWESIISSNDQVPYMSETEHDAYYEKTRILDYEFEEYVTPEDINAMKIPREVRFIRIYYYLITHNSINALLSKLPHLHTVDLNHMEITSDRLKEFGNCNVINYSTYIDLSHTDTDFSQSWIRKNQISDQKDLDLYSTYLKALSDQYNVFSTKLKYVNMTKTYGDSYFVLNAREYETIDTLLPFAKHIRLKMYESQITNLADMMFGLTIETLDIKIIGKNEYRRRYDYYEYNIDDVDDIDDHVYTWPEREHTIKWAEDLLNEDTEVKRLTIDFTD